MRYQLAPLYCRPWTLNGISARLIESHYENNYGAALNRLNAISEEIERLDLGSTPDPVACPAEARRDCRAQFDASARIVFCKPRRRRARRAGRPRERHRKGFRIGRSLAPGVRRHCVRTGRWLGLGVADLCSARRTAHQSDRVGTQSEHRRRRPDPRPRYVRARLPPGIRRQRQRLHRRIHAQHRLVRRTSSDTTMPSRSRLRGPSSKRSLPTCRRFPSRKSGR